jgi:ribonuclease H / adenosylcobalamin/alpha-ribazole phosphatase
VTRRLTVEADGGSRGNPGVAGYGALVRDTDTGALLAERAEPLGTVSNNVAEYRGLIAGLEAALAIDGTAEVVARLDSKLVVEQMSGRWKIKHEDMRRLALRARDLVAEITGAGGSVRFEWVPRSENNDADALSNVAMDGHSVDRRLDGEVPVECAPVARRVGTPVRVVLVAQASGEAVRTAATAVAQLLGGAPRCLVTARSEDAVETAAEVGAALGADPLLDPVWDGAGPDLGAAWARIVDRGGTTVVVCAPDAVRGVLGHVLGVPEDRRSRIAVAPGSLAGIEVWGDDDVSVAFTNRT